MKFANKILAFFLVVTMIFVAIPFMSVSAGEYALYRQHMINIGFPESYADKLTNLHLLHPDWIFEPADITGMSQQYGRGTYTWDYVISREMSPEDTNLVSSYTGSAYIKNYTQYDSGWYPANTSAVKYAMDPRNFLDERHIFMFLDLYKGDTVYTVSDIEVALSGTFMHNTVIPDSGNTKTYAQYFYELGNQYNVNPVFIAARLKQEQGVDGDSPLISGTCGTTLYNSYKNGTNGAPSSGYGSSLKDYDNLYNYFNIGASGDGYFYIWLGGMKEAQTGVTETGPWNTRMKAIEGGVVKLRDTYLASYRHTLYYQKFNVDARSVINGSCANFTHQYMQNLMAPYSEGRIMQTALASNLEIKFKFIIPVYSGMPSSTSDPGTYYQKDRFSYANAIDSPVATSNSGSISEISCTINTDENPTLHFAGWGLSTKMTTGYYYNIDKSSNWTQISDVWLRSDVQNSMSSYPSHSINAYAATIDISHLSPGTHVIVIKGRTGNISDSVGPQNFPIALINLTVESELSSVRKSLDTPAADTVPSVEHGSYLHTSGWALVSSGITAFKLSIDDGAEVTLPTWTREDVLAQDATLAEACQDCHAYRYDIPTSDLNIGDHKAVITAYTKSGLKFTAGSFTFNVKLGSSYTIPVFDDSGYTYTKYGNEDTLFGIQANSTVEDVLNNIDATCVILDSLGNKVTSGKVASGYVVKRVVGGVYAASGTIIITGDYTGDGVINGADAIRIKKQILGLSPIGYTAAADFDRNGTVTQNDLENIVSLIDN